MINTTELIPISYESDRPTVSARELHKFLEVKTDFAHWFDRMAEYGFSQGTDFQTFLSESTGGRPAQDAQLTIDMAKELCMIQRTERGKEARHYFIEVEKSWNDPATVMARALKMADAKIKHLEMQAEENKSKVLFANSVSGSKTSILIRDLAKLISQNGNKIGEKRLFEWLRVNGYLISKYGRDRNSPTQKSMEMKLMEVKETAIAHSDGTYTEKTPLITGKGQQYFINKFISKDGEEIESGRQD